jgi:hypothetical protein
MKYLFLFDHVVTSLALKKSSPNKTGCYIFIYPKILKKFSKDMYYQRHVWSYRVFDALDRFKMCLFVSVEPITLTPSFPWDGD